MRRNTGVASGWGGWMGSMNSTINVAFRSASGSGQTKIILPSRTTSCQSCCTSVLTASIVSSATTPVLVPRCWCKSPCVSMIHCSCHWWADSSIKRRNSSKLVSSMVGEKVSGLGMRGSSSKKSIATQPISSSSTVRISLGWCTDVAVCNRATDSSLDLDRLLPTSHDLSVLSSSLELCSSDGVEEL